MQTAIIDYESGNLHSARKAFERIAAETNTGSVTVTSDPDVVARADRIVLPGDGAFPACRDALLASDVYAAMNEAVVVRGRPFLGICVGMQLMAQDGAEYRTTPGLGWVHGSVQRIAPKDATFKIPHMGWNTISVNKADPIVKKNLNEKDFYFVHSYIYENINKENILGLTTYGKNFPSIINKGNIYGVQFHPEKSHKNGLKLIKNFIMKS